MDTKRFGQTIVARIDRGEEVVSKVMELVKKENIKLGTITAIGATGEVKMGLYDTEKKEYKQTHFKGEFEITNLTGNITTMNGETYLHIHITIADEEFNAYGGHLNELIISGTCEMFIQVIEAEVDRQLDEETGLNVFKF